MGIKKPKGIKINDPYITFFYFRNLFYFNLTAFHTNAINICALEDLNTSSHNKTIYIILSHILKIIVLR